MCDIVSLFLLSDVCNKSYMYSSNSPPFRNKYIFYIWTTFTCFQNEGSDLDYCIFQKRSDSIQLSIFIFCWPCISLQIFGNNQLDALFHVFIYFMSLHVWASQGSSSGDRIVLLHHLVWLVCVTAWYAGQEFPPDRHTKQSLTQTSHTRWCINTIRSPDDDRCDARNT